jgi:hypothetical protein
MTFYYSFFSPLTSTVKESFENRLSPSLGLAAALAIIILLVVQVFIVQFLWNTVLVSTVSGVKPLKSFIYTLGLLVLVAMLFPGSM